MKTNAPVLSQDFMQEKPAYQRSGGVRGSGVLALLFTALILTSNPADAEVRVVGGHSADIADFPYQVALIRLPYNAADIDPDQFCGGSIVDSEWILTAAHCSVGKTPGGVAVAVGVTDLTRPQTGRIFHVDRIVIHPNYNSSTEENDVALWHLSTPIEFNSTYSARPIGLVSSADAYGGLTAAGRLATITGWGNTSGTGASYPTRLQAATVPITVQSDYSAGWITADMIMAGFAAGGVDTCQGDSGGPLVVTNAAGTVLQAGVTSWGDGCAERGYPGVYARVSHQYTWLMSHLPKRVLHVDWRFTSAKPDGSPARPFPNVGQGYANVAVAGTLKIRSGNYLVRFPLDKPLLLEPYDGAVRLGGRVGNGFEPDGRSIVELPPPTLGTTGRQADGTFALHFTAVAGERYQVLTSTNLVTWDLWKDCVAGSDAVDIVDADAAVTPHRFFKVVVP